jgi:hypothetical protein
MRTKAVSPLRDAERRRPLGVTAPRLAVLVRPKAVHGPRARTRVDTGREYRRMPVSCGKTGTSPKTSGMHWLRSLPTVAPSGGIWIIRVEEWPHVPVLTTFLPSPAPPIQAATAEHEDQDDYYNQERRDVHYLPLLSFRCHSLGAISKHGLTTRCSLFVLLERAVLSEKTKGSCRVSEMEKQAISLRPISWDVRKSPRAPCMWHIP